MNSVWNLVRAWVRPAAMAGLWLWFTLAACAQGTAPDASIGAALRSLAARADVVFAGRVTAIRREAGAAGSAGSVAIDFHVDESLAGNIGSTYTLREWGGLWAAGQHRYWVGERVAIFLHAPSKASLSSPVDGMEGVLPIVQETAQSEPFVDLRRVATRLLRAHNEPLQATASGLKLRDLKPFVTQSSALREPVLYPLPVGVGPYPPSQKEPQPRPLQPDRPDGNAPGLHALLEPVDPERKAVDESPVGAH